MVLAAIYNVWDGEEHLLQSVKYILEDVDIIIIVWQNVSNFQENYMPNLVPIGKLKSDKIRYIQYNPDFRYTDIDVGYKNELQKRQLGVDIAKISGASHFLLLDTDEFYPDLPWFLSGMRPSGYLGRLIPKRHKDLDVPADIGMWSGEDCLVYLSKYGWNTSGNIILGDDAYQLYLKNCLQLRY